MKKLAFGLAALMLAGSALGCCVLPQFPTIRIPDIDIRVPSVEIGEVQDKEETVPLSGEESADVDIRIGAGELEIAAGEGDALFAGRFTYNVSEWEPEVRYESGELSIQQGRAESIPLGDMNIRNEWHLAFSPEVPLEVNLRIGAGEGSLDLTGLQLTELDVDMGAGSLEVRFEEPNRSDMRRLTIDAGAGELRISGIGHAGPERVRVQGGAGDLHLDFTGDWRRSSDVSITAGVGQVTLVLPAGVGVRVEKRGGLTSVEAPDFRRLGDAFVNEAYGGAEIELRIEVTAGIGSIELIEASES
jgi:hypothetical protein